MSGIFTGGIAINSLKVGISEIAKVMLGGDEVWSSVPDAMVVEGAGSTEANGLYLRDGEFGGKPRYTIIGGSNVGNQNSIFYDDQETIGFFWYIGGNFAYGSTDNTPTPDLAETWLVNTGTPPAPTVRRATAEDF